MNTQVRLGMQIAFWRVRRKTEPTGHGGRKGSSDESSD